MIEGRLVRGLGQAAHFTRIDRVPRKFVELAAIDPFPGTFHLAYPMRRQTAPRCAGR